MSRTFFITGVSTGLGRAFAEEAAAAGNQVVGTVRNADQIAEIEAIAPGRTFGRVLDVTDYDAISPLVEEIEANVGPIDVLICNAGYGHEGTVEESSMDDLRRQFDVNVFGATATIKAVLPGMRQRRSGHIFVITSMGGLTTFPGVAFYHGSKFAMEGIVSSLAQEVAGFGVHVTAVAPGGFRTDWAGRSMVRAPRSVSDYDELFDPIRATRQANSGRQLGNPTLAGKAIIEVIEAENPPVHLLLGSDALRLVAAGRQKVSDDIATWEKLSVSTDYSDGAQL
jgi:NAD(P)-dependent dehydrogenase (short-subunit alcohol dehydrogenase family)